MILEKCKSKVAQSVVDMITEIIINDDVSIKDFDSKQFNGNVAVVNFPIPQNIKIVEKLIIKSGDDILCDSVLYFERGTEDYQLSYRIEVHNFE